MWATVHANFGAALAKNITNPWLLAGAAVASHFGLDLIPHWDYPARPLYAGIDLGMAILTVTLVAEGSRHIWWGVFWAVIPDLQVIYMYYRHSPLLKTSFDSLKNPSRLSKIIIQPAIILVLWHLFF